MDNSKSKEIFSRLKTYIPGGVNSPVRAFRGVNSDPVIIKSGNGSTIEDVDGNKYIDFASGIWFAGKVGDAIRTAVGEYGPEFVSGPFGGDKNSDLHQLYIDLLKS